MTTCGWFVMFAEPPPPNARHIRNTPSCWQGGWEAVWTRMHHFAIFCGNTIGWEKLAGCTGCLVMLHIMWGRREQSGWHQASPFPSSHFWSHFSAVGWFMLCCERILVCQMVIPWYKPSDQPWFVTRKVHTSPQLLTALPKHRNIGQPEPVSGLQSSTNEKACLETQVTNQRPANCHPSHPSADLPSSKMRHGPPVSQFCSFPGKLDKPRHIFVGCKLESAEGCTGLQWPFLWCCMNHLAVSAALQHSLHAALIRPWPCCNTQKIEQ